MEKLKSEWEATSTRSRVLLGIVAAAVVVICALSFGGVIDVIGAP